MLSGLEYVLAKQSITDIGLRYATAIDKRDIDAFCSCFTKDALWVSDVHEARGHHEMRHVLGQAISSLDATQHIASNFEISLDGEKAAMRSCFIATHVRLPFPHYVMGGFYDDELVREGDDWLISTRRLTIQWTTGDASIVGNLGR